MASMKDRWHEGEKAMHRRLHMEDNAQSISDFVRGAMPEQHRTLSAHRTSAWVRQQSRLPRTR